MTTENSIVRLVDVADWPQKEADLTSIFFAASATRSFADGSVREAFRDRWLGRYLRHTPELAHVAVDAGGAIIGYIVGAHDDPAVDPMFSDIGYWPVIAHLTVFYPAHLHINLTSEARNRGIGSQLIEAFLQDAKAAGVAGTHLVTGRDSRNRSFYARHGFIETAGFIWGGTPIVMLAKAL